MMAVVVLAVLLMVVFESVALCIFWEVRFIARWMFQYQESISLQLDFLSTGENQPMPSSQPNAPLDGGLQANKFFLGSIVSGDQDTL